MVDRFLNWLIGPDLKTTLLGYLGAAAVSGTSAVANGGAPSKEAMAISALTAIAGRVIDARTQKEKAKDKNENIAPTQP